MTRILKEVADADEIVRRIKGKKTEAELIEEQKKRKPKKEPEEDESRQLPHSMDSHSSGSFIWTPKGTGIFLSETTLTRFTEKRKPR